MIQKRLVDQLALRLLEGEFSPGDRVRVDEGRERSFAAAPTEVGTMA